MAYILCADDEESVRLLVKQILRMAGHEVEMAVDGRDAIACIEKREPDLVVLDWSMPFVDGPAVCEYIKANPFLSRIPVLMLTAQASIEDKVRGFEAGADDFLAKPFEPRELTARILSLLRLVQREGDRNPSSGLPGGLALGRHVEGLLKNQQSFTVVYIDLDHFKPFADTFGFAAADQVIAGLGAMLGELSAEFKAFAGHIGGDDFLLVCESDAASELARMALERYENLVAEVVGPGLAATQRFTGLDRDGLPKEFPLARLTAVLIRVDPQSWISLSHLGEAAATWKKAARTGGTEAIIVANV